MLTPMQSNSLSSNIAAVHQSVKDQQQRDNLYHLYADIIGYGVLAGSTLAFIAVYLTRLGATNTQIGLLTAGPAIVTLAIALPAGQWIASRKLTTVVFRSSVLNRLIYPCLIPLTIFASTSEQISLILLLVLLTSVPGAVLAIAFNAMYAAAVPDAYRGVVAGRRNALMALTMLLVSLLSGQILGFLSFEWGYLVIFLMGALGAVYSSYHLWRIDLPDTPINANNHVQPGEPIRISRPLLLPDMPLQRIFPIRLLSRSGRIDLSGVLSPLRTSFAPFLVALFAFHFAQYVPIPLFPLYWVRDLQLDDAAISLINVSYYGIMLLASLQLGRLTSRYGNKKLVVIGSLMLALYPLLTAFSQNIQLLLVTNAFGGIVWAVLAGALANRLLERVPGDDRPRHLALYNLALNAAILTGVFVGVYIADRIGLRDTLFLSFGFRAIAALLLALWG